MTSGTCGNHWKYGKDVCVREAGHIGPHRNTEEEAAHTYRWFDSEGKAPTGGEKGGKMSDLADGTRVCFADNPRFTGTVIGSESQLRTVDGPKVPFGSGQGYVGQRVTVYWVIWDDPSVAGRDMFYRGELRAL